MLPRSRRRTCPLSHTVSERIRRSPRCRSCGRLPIQAGLSLDAGAPSSLLEASLLEA